MMIIFCNCLPQLYKTQTMRVVSFSILYRFNSSIFDTSWRIKIGLSHFQMNDMLTSLFHLGCLFHKHLGLWNRKARPPPKAAEPPKYGIDYTSSQLPPSDDYLYVDVEYQDTFLS